MDEIIELGRGDLDNRVAMISEIMKPYPETGILKFEAPEAERFQKLLTEFTQDFEKECKRHKKKHKYAIFWMILMYFISKRTNADC